MESAGKRIAEMRRERGWSQGELARRIGVSRQQVLRYETRGIQNMRARRLALLCTELGCSADELLGIWGSPQPRRREAGAIRTTGIVR